MSRNERHPQASGGEHRQRKREAIGQEEAELVAGTDAELGERAGQAPHALGEVAVRDGGAGAGDERARLAVSGALVDDGADRPGQLLRVHGPAGGGSSGHKSLIASRYAGMPAATTLSATAS